MSTTQAPALDMNKLNAFIGQFVTDLGASVHAGMVVIGEKLGLYKALAARPMGSAELAAKTQTDERYLREWLASQAAGGYVTYDEEIREVQPQPGAGLYTGKRREPRVSSRGIRAGIGITRRRPSDRRLVPNRQGNGLA